MKLSIFIIIVTTLLIIAIFLSYLKGWGWAGIYISQTPGTGSWKTLWVWLELLIIPSALTLTAILFNKAENRRNTEEAEFRTESERRIENERWQEAILDGFIDQMSNLLLNHGLAANSECNT